MHHRAKLTDREVNEIRHLYTLGINSHRIAKHFSVSQATITYRTKGIERMSLDNILASTKNGPTSTLHSVQPQSEEALAA